MGILTDIAKFWKKKYHLARFRQKLTTSCRTAIRSQPGVCFDSNNFIVLKNLSPVIFVPTPFEGWAELYTQMSFFVLSTLIDRYVHRREV